MGQTPHVLVVEDSEDDYELLARALRSTATTERVASAAGMAAALARQQWAAVICDYGLPGFSMPEALAQVQASGEDIPFIVVTGTLGEERAAEIMRSGASDLILKENIGSRLVPALNRDLTAAVTRRLARAASAAIRSQEEQLASMARNVPGLIYRCVLRSDGCFEFPFVAGQLETGIVIDSGNAASILSTAHGDDDECLLAKLRRSSEDLSPVAEDIRLLLPSGDSRWLQTRSRPRREADGSVVWDAVAVDVTASRLAAERLAESESFLRMASQVSRLGAWRLDIAERKLTWSEGLKRITEIPLDNNPTAEEALAFYPFDQRDLIRNALDACITEGAPFDLDLRYHTGTGRKIWVRAIGEAVRDASGRTIRVHGALQDISQAKQAEQLLRESGERFRLLSHATKDAIWDWNITTDMIWRNENFATLFGLDSTGTRGREMFLDRVHPDDRARVDAWLQEAIDENRETWSHTYRLRRADGIYAHVMARGHAIRGPDGRAVRLVGAITDLTDQRRLEEQLRQSQKMEAIGQLTGGVAHDFNNLMAVIQGNLELIRDDLANPQVPAMIQDALEANQRGASLTRQLLAYSRQQPLDPCNVAPEGIVSNLVRMLDRTLGPAIQITTAITDRPWEVHIDPAQLDTALLNLAVNARDAMPEGGKLTIAVENATIDARYAQLNPEVTPGEYVIFAVSDTGTGMAPHVLARVTDPFFTTKPAGKGTGLGLSMVYGFVKQSGGHLKISSEVGDGTTVRLYLPRALSALPTAKPPPATAALTSVTGELILVLEDDPAVRRLTVRVLAGLGYRVLEAADGASALRLLDEAGPVDLLLTDVGLAQGPNGAAIARAARARWPGLKVIFMSGYTRHAMTRDGGLEAGVHLLTKPFRKATLAAKLREVLEKV